MYNMVTRPSYAIFVRGGGAEVAAASASDVCRSAATQCNCARPMMAVWSNRNASVCARLLSATCVRFNGVDVDVQFRARPLPPPDPRASNHWLRRPLVAAVAVGAAHAAAHCTAKRWATAACGNMIIIIRNALAGTTTQTRIHAYTIHRTTTITIA